MQAQIYRPNCKFIAISVVAGVATFLLFAYNNGALRKNAVEHNKVVSVGEGDWTFGLDGILPSDDGSIWDILMSNNSRSVLNEDFFGVMFDAGSTGTRVHVFHFQNGLKGRLPFLISEVFNQTQHGLAEFADTPDKAVEVVSHLLDVAMESIPRDLWSSTPVALKATAGLRLIPHGKAQIILDRVYELFLKCPLHTETKNHTVAIIDGIHEGEYVWFTVNFLRGVLGSRDHPTNKTMGVLDLGGGSTQITFAPKLQETVDSGMPRGLIKTFRFMTDTFQLYTHSYLGLGLKAARLDTLRLEAQQGTSQSTKSKFHTVCLPANATVSWQFAGLTYTTLSSNGPEVSNTFTLCSDVTKHFMGDKVYNTSEIRNLKFYASSYFIGKGVESRMIDKKYGGIVRVKEFAKIAENVCGAYDAANPFLCMDLVYINTLLTHGYGFNTETELVMNERIRGFDISWALGATIDLLHTHWDHISEANKS